MRTLILQIGICLAVLPANAAIYTVVSDGLHFVPDNVVARVGDTIEFDLNAGFTATEVSATTWSLNGNTPLVAQGAFNIDGPGMVVMETEGNRYYVCKWHNTTGMKGMIQVLGPTGVPQNQPELMVTIYPNPVINNLYLNIVGSNNVPVSMDIFDMNGQKVLDLGGKQVLSNGVKSIDVSMLPNGFYLIEMTYYGKLKSIRFLKQ
jgi:plastocyanin